MSWTVTGRQKVVQLLHESSSIPRMEEACKEPVNANGAQSSPLIYLFLSRKCLAICSEDERNFELFYDTDSNAEMSVVPVVEKGRVIRAHNDRLAPVRQVSLSNRAQKQRRTAGTVPTAFGTNSRWQAQKTAKQLVTHCTSHHVTVTSILGFRQRSA